MVILQDLFLEGTRLLAAGLEAGRAVIRSILLEFIDGPKERMTAPRDGFLPLPFKPAAVRWPRCASLLRYARFARRILCPAGFLVALVFSRSKNASSNSSYSMTSWPTVNKRRPRGRRVTAAVNRTRLRAGGRSDQTAAVTLTVGF